MKKRVLMLCLSLFFAGTVFGQGYEFKPLKFTKIDGAPKLSNPQFVLTDKKTPVTVVKLGMAGPAIYDWDHDGKNDLLVGEFGSGSNSNLVIFKNTGTNKEPVYSADTTYAVDKNGRMLHIEGS